MTLNRLVLLSCLCLGTAGALSPVWAQGAAAPTTAAVSIAAVVNDEIVTLREVQSRLALFLATSGIDSTPDVQRRLVPQVIQALIDERLKLQEARRQEIKVTEEEIRNSLVLIEQRNGMPPG